MHSRKKGNQWHFGIKAHIGVDADSGLVHTVRGTSGHVSDISEGNTLLHGQESIAYCDAGYQGIEKRPDAESNVNLEFAKLERSPAGGPFAQAFAPVASAPTNP